MTHFTHPPEKQRGAVLLIGMVLLAIMMMGAVSIMTATVSDEKITGNSKASTEAFFAAEAGYLAAIEHLTPKVDPNDPDSETNTQLAKTRWNSLYALIEDFDDINSWQENQSIKPGDLNAGEHYAVSIAPVFRTVMKNGAPVSERVPGKIKFVSRGAIGGAVRTIGFDLEGGGGGGLPPAPAAISCFGGNCFIQAGAANKAPISGVDHPMPNPGCGGNNCRTAGDYDSEHNVPAVYLSNFNDPCTNNSPCSQVGQQGNNGNSNKVSFEGADRKYADRDNHYQFIADSGKTKEDNSSIWGPGDYDKSPKDTPLDSEYAGAEATLLKEIYAEAENAPSDFSGPITVIDTNESNTNFPISGKHQGVVIIEGKGPNGTSNTLTTDTGSGYFAGLIILKDCNSLSFSGTPFVFGAIIVDATDCPDDYMPFVGKGNPEVLYSSEALEAAGSGIGGGLVGGNQDWYEVVGG